MKVGIMQPYFMPYMGYFQLMNVVDTFVVYDDIQYTKKGWINRNRFLVNGKDDFFSLPLKKDSDFLDIRDRQLSDSYQQDCEKLLRRIEQAYRKAPFFREVYPAVSECFTYHDHNLFQFILHSIMRVKQLLGIETTITISSDLGIDRNLKGKDRVIATCIKLGSDHYINPIGGLKLYDKSEFLQKGIQLDFIKTMDITYRQFNHDHVPFLSIIDVMMFNSQAAIKGMLQDYRLE